MIRNRLVVKRTAALRVQEGYVFEKLYICTTLACTVAAFKGRKSKHLNKWWRADSSDQSNKSQK